MIEGFRILRSRDDKLYLPLDSVPATQRMYTIAEVTGYPYYRLQAKVKRGMPLTSSQVLIQPIDSIPPSVPEGLKATIDSLGWVHLSWQAGQEGALHGYRLYRAETEGRSSFPSQARLLSGQATSIVYA